MLLLPEMQDKCKLCSQRQHWFESWLSCVLNSLTSRNVNIYAVFLLKLFWKEKWSADRNRQPPKALCVRISVFLVQNDSLLFDLSANRQAISLAGRNFIFLSNLVSFWLVYAYAHRLYCLDVDCKVLVLSNSREEYLSFVKAPICFLSVVNAGYHGSLKILNI